MILAVDVGPSVHEHLHYTGMSSIRGPMQGCVPRLRHIWSIISTVSQGNGYTKSSPAYFILVVNIGSSVQKYPYDGGMPIPRGPVKSRVTILQFIGTHQSSLIETGPSSTPFDLTLVSWWMLAPRSNSISTIAVCPLSEAQWRAVEPPYSTSAYIVPSIPVNNSSLRQVALQLLSILQYSYGRPSPRCSRASPR